MEFTLQSAFSPQGMLGHTAYLLLVASMLMRRMLYLRLLVIASALVSIAYTAFVLNDPVSTFWESLLIATNILQITRNWLKERRAGFTAEELVLAHKGLPGLPLAVARAFLDCGRWETLAPGTLLAKQDSPPTRFFWLAEGAVSIRLDGEPVGMASGNEFIGESAVLGGMASATAVVCEPARAWVIDAAKLSACLIASPALRQALESGLVRDARIKLERANRMMRARPGPAARTPVTLQALPVSP